MTDPQGDIDFFISYRGARTDWALWVNWVVRSAGYSTVLMDEFPVGTTWTSNMRNAARDCRRLIPLYSTDYWASGACVEEYDAYWQHHLQNGAARFLLPLEIQPCTVPDMHKVLLWKTIHTLTRDEARAAILKVLQGIAAVSPTTTVFKDTEPPFPGVKPALTTSAVPPPAFTSTTTKVDRKDFVDCTPAFEAFERMMTASPCEQILLVHGHGKQGKSTLLTLLFRHARKQFGPKSSAFAEFKLGGSGPEEILRDISRSLGVPPPSGNLDERVDALLDACVDRPTLLFLDAYEHAELPHQHWVERVLRRCVDDTNLRVIIAGRSIPAAKGRLWAHQASETECDALKEHEALVDHALARGFTGKPDEIRLLVTRLTSMRDRLHSMGHIDHGISSETLLAEIQTMCIGGAALG